MRALMPFIFIAVLATPVLADVATEVTELDAAVAARITAIGTPADKAEKKELKNLTKGRGLLANYVGNNDLADFAALAKAVKTIVKSKTTDAAIFAELEDLVAEFLAFVENHKAQAVAAAQAIGDAGYAAKCQNVIDKGTLTLDKAKLILSDYPKAWKLILKAWKKYGSAIKKADKFRQKLAGSSKGWPQGLDIGNSPFAFVLVNSTKTAYWMSDVIVDGTIRDEMGATVATVNMVSVRAMWPDLFVTTHYGGGGFDAHHHIERKYDPDPSPQHDLWQYLTGWHESTGVYTRLYLTGNISFRISKKDDGKTQYQMSIPVTDRGF